VAFGLSVTRVGSAAQTSSMKQVGGAFKIDMAFNLSIILPHLAVGTAWLNLFIPSSGIMPLAESSLSLVWSKCHHFYFLRDLGSERFECRSGLKSLVKHIASTRSAMVKQVVASIFNSTTATEELLTRHH
jgi:hypothetical protein